MTDVERPHSHSAPSSRKVRKALRWAVAPVLTVVAVSGTTVIVGPSLGGADPLSDAKAQAAQLQAEIQATGQRIDSLDQQYQAAKLQKAHIDGQIQATQTKIAQTKQQIGQDQLTLRRAAVNAYVTAGASGGADSLFTGNQSQAAAATVYTDVVQGDVSAVVDDLNTAQSQLDVQEATLQNQDQQAQAAVNAANQAYQQAQGLESEQQANLNRVNAQIQQLIVQAQQAALAAAQAAAKQKQAQEEADLAAEQRDQQQASAVVARDVGGGAAVSSTASDPPVPTAPGGEGAVQAAETQLGVPYVWGGETPGVGFDCSGLTAWSWGRVGVPLPHYSGAQMSDSTPVPVSQLEAGDLLFYGPGGSEHVAMYVGPGTMIEAPYTGAVVWLTALRLGDGFVGAGRP